MSQHYTMIYGKPNFGIEILAIASVKKKMSSGACHHAASPVYQICYAGLIMLFLNCILIKRFN